mgnify:FL=1
MHNPIEDARSITNFALLTYAWVIILSTWGGLVHYISKVRSGNIAKFNITELIGDICISGFTGLLTFWLCQAAGFDELITAVFVGISGHMGARLIGKMEQMMTKKLNIPEEGPSKPADPNQRGSGVF